MSFEIIAFNLITLLFVIEVMMTGGFETFYFRETAYFQRQIIPYFGAVIGKFVQSKIVFWNKRQF